MSKFLTSVCTYTPPTPNPKPQTLKPQTLNPKPQTYKDILLIKFLMMQKRVRIWLLPGRVNEYVVLITYMTSDVFQNYFWVWIGRRETECEILEKYV